MPITATYTPAQFKLSILGTVDPDGIFISRNVAGTLFVNGGAVPVTGGPATVANTSLIEATGSTGADTIVLDETNGALPAAALYGGGGGDALSGGSGGDSLYGEADDDTLVGWGGSDLLFGGTGNDILTGGDGDDQMFGEDGNDRMIWNPGDDTDLMEGGIGSDTVEVNGGNGAESFTVTANGTRVRFDRLTPAPFTLDIGTTEALVLYAGGGDDAISTSGSLSTLISLTLDGGAGNDSILGSNGADILIGGDGNDFVDGQQSNDTAFLGNGNDVFQWDPGDGSDVVEGQADFDSLLFNGSGANEIFNIAANGARVLFTRDVGAIAMDMNDLESFTVNALGGIDTFTVNDLSGTDATTIALNLAGTIGGSTGDAQADTLNVNGSNSANSIDITGAGTSFNVAGLATSIAVANSEGANDQLVINALGGDDGVVATTLPAGVVKLTLDGGAGHDTILGSQGADTILAGDGNDFVFGDNGNDLALLGIGNDLFGWAPGDGNDVVEGQAGFDELLFDGSNASENVNIAANGGRILFTRDVAAITMDLDDVEHIRFNAIGGADNIVVGDLTGTDATDIELHLEIPAGGGDGAIDTVTVNSTAGADALAASSSGAVVLVTGLPWTVAFAGSEGANDRLVLNGQAGDDVINASTLAAGLVALTVNGGLGADVILGSAGGDLVNGGDGNDLALMGGGDDTFTWNPGDDNDTIEGQAGTDTLSFNGAAIAENISISANGGRVMFFRDVAAVTMDMNDLEAITYNALGGADNLTLNDMSGTDFQGLTVNLAGTLGGTTGDGQADTLTIHGTGGDDSVIFAGTAGAMVIAFLGGSGIAINQLEAADAITVNAGDGNDSLSAATIANKPNLTLDGGAGNDVLASGGDGTYLGGSGDDYIQAGLTYTFENLDGGDGVDGLDTTTWDGAYVINMVTGATNFGESFTNFENLLSGAGADTVTATAGDNVIFTQGGADIVNGGAGNDVLDGGTGNDGLDGGADNDWLLGGDGNDTETGGTGNDSLWGGIGNDYLDGGTGDDTIIGEEGYDTVTYAFASSGVEVDLSWPEDQDTRGAGWDTLIGIESLVGSAHDDRLTGDGAVNDLRAGAGADVLTGGEGNDAFHFDDLDSTTAAPDLITDFAPGDRIVLFWIDADTVAPGDQAFHLGATAGHTGDVVLAFDAGNDRTSLSLYVNGDAVADGLIWLSGNHTALAGADFVL